MRTARLVPTNAAFATETVIDEICRELKIAPVDFRLKNAAQEGTRRVDGVTYPRIGMRETVEAIQASDHWASGIREEPPEALHVTGNGAESRLAYGRGLASGFWFNAGLKSSLTATVNADGKISLVEGSTDIGGTRTSIAMQLAETLGISAEDVNPLVADTDSVGYNDVTGGSRVTHTTGLAAYEAGMQIRGPDAGAGRRDLGCRSRLRGVRGRRCHGAERETDVVRRIGGEGFAVGRTVEC